MLPNSSSSLAAYENCGLKRATEDSCMDKGIPSGELEDNYQMKLE